MLEKFGIDLARVKRTLAFVCQVEREDIIASRASRLADPEFISRHFEMIKWNPDKSQSALFSDKKPLLKNIPDNKILVTKYYIKLASGSNKKSDQFPYALYALPHDEQDMSLEQANQHKKDLTRYQLTKQQVLTGVIDQKRLATPLVWLSRADLEDSLMQGTVKVTANGHSEFYNVHRNNDIGYKRNLSKYDQQRYWYFKQTSTVLGYGKDANYKIPIQPLVTVAGDLKFFGLGKLLLLTNDGESRLVILADTGGAFEGNQYQLDYLGGFFENWTDYINTYRTFPDYFEARILVLKE
jgi:membrane-bound lytic murein transglycosylase